MTGKTVCGYTITGKIGEGGMGVVYLAQNGAGMNVAVKTLKSELAEDPKMLNRFRNECQAMIRLEGHPNIVQIRGIGDMNDLPCLIMEYLEGGLDLNSHIAENGAITDEKLLTEWLLQILSALDYAHTLTPKIIHRDIKPSNLFLTRFGQIKLLDFGIVKVIEESSDPDVTLKTLTSTTSKLGSISYMSPEQTFDPKLVDERSDIYSFGKTLKALMTGGNPFVKITSEPFKTIIEKSTLDHPGERYQDCKEILQILQTSINAVSGEQSKETQKCPHCKALGIPQEAILCPECGKSLGATKNANRKSIPIGDPKAWGNNEWILCDLEKLV